MSTITVITYLIFLHHPVVVEVVEVGALHHQEVVVVEVGVHHHLQVVVEVGVYSLQTVYLPST